MSERKRGPRERGNHRDEDPEREPPHCCPGTVGGIAFCEAGGSLSHADVSESFGSPAAIGRSFLTDHLLAFEITSIVLLIAAVGGVVLGSHARREHWGSEAA